MAAYTPLDTWRVQDIPLPLFWASQFEHWKPYLASYHLRKWPEASSLGMEQSVVKYARADWAGGQVGKVRAPGGSDTTKTLLSNPTASTIHR